MKSNRYLELLMDLFCSSGTTRMIVTFLGTFMTVSSNIISPPPSVSENESVVVLNIIYGLCVYKHVHI